MTATSQRLPGRILMTVDASAESWTYAIELARSLSVYGVWIDLALMGPPPSFAQRAEAVGLPNVTFHEGAYALEWMDDPWDEVDRAGKWLLELAQKTQPDLIHLNGYVHANLPWHKPVLLAAHSCIYSWWSGVRDEGVPARFEEYRQRVRAGLAAADLVVAPTAAMLQELDQHYGVDVWGRVIHNARASKQFSPARKIPKIFTAGRAWDPAKNLAVLNEAAPAVRWPIYLAGDSHHPGGGRPAQFDNMRCLGKLDTPAMRQHFAESAIYALPACYEPFGLSALEAGLCGCALVLGDIPSLREVWSDAAIFVHPADGQELAAALNGLIKDDAHRQEMSRRALGRAQGYTPTKMAQQYLAAYQACREPSLMEAAA